MSYISISNIYKSYYKQSDDEITKLSVLENISFAVEKGEFITFFGPNGCGKTTLLKVIAKLEEPDNGSVKLEGKESDHYNIGFIFQNYAESLYPWRTNLKNIALALQLNGYNKKQSIKLAKKFLDEIGILTDLNAFPYQLSGGQKQLIAIARGLVNNPDFLLMDEPFSSLDYQTRFEMQSKILDIWSRTNKTILFVSHEIDEAIFLADKVIVLSKRPAKIRDIIETRLPRPRDHSILKTGEFINLKNRVLDLFIRELENK